MATAAAAHVMNTFGFPLSPVPAAQLNDLVAAFLPPAMAARELKIPIGTVPILFAEVSPRQVGAVMARFTLGNEKHFPIFYMPTDRMDDWAVNEEAVELMAFLDSYGLDIQLTTDGAPTWLRGHWVVLCDMRLRFTRDVSQDDITLLVEKLTPGLIEQDLGNENQYLTKGDN
jgi:hypothetical protein